MVIIMAVFPAMLFGETAGSRANVCPDNLKSALIAINRSLSSKKWIDIDLKACPHIQAEIIESVDKIIDSAEFEKYFALMDQTTMRIVRNSFFAKKGYKFEDATLQKHFAGYSWYKPAENSNIVLTEAENHKVRLLKSIEETLIAKAYTEDWKLEDQPLPSGVKMLKKGEKTFLNIGGRSLLDITPSGEGWSKHFYKVHGNASQGSVLVCSQQRHGDSRHVEKMSLYSANGSRSFNFDNKNDDYINGFEQCPQWTSQRPNILISYNNVGCCGAIWDILATFNAQLKPIAVLNCSEQNCDGTTLFAELNENNLYLFVRSQGGYSVGKNKSAVKTINYDGSQDVLPDGKYTNKWALWTIEENGDLALVVEVVEIVHNKPASPGSWYVIKDVPYPTVTLMASSQAGSEEAASGEILTSVKLGSFLILYRYDNGHYGTTMIPVQ